jgi:hypothetical protein
VPLPIGAAKKRNLPGKIPGEIRCQLNDEYKITGESASQLDLYFEEEE